MWSNRHVRYHSNFGVMLLLYQLVQYGFDKIPPVTLFTILGQAAIFLRIGDLTRWFPSSRDICLSADFVWRQGQWSRLVLAALFHGSDMHLYCNMISMLSKGEHLEKKFKSRPFAFLLVTFTCLSGIGYVLMGMAISLVLQDPSYEEQCAIGFSGVLFALKVVSVHYSPRGLHYVLGFIPVASKYVYWVELGIIHIIYPNASFIGHLSGILVGYSYTHGPLKAFMDGIVESFQPTRRRRFYQYSSSCQQTNNVDNEGQGTHTQSDGENRGRGVPDLEELRRRREQRYPKTAPIKLRPLSGTTFKMFLRPIPIGNNTTTAPTYTYKSGATGFKNQKDKGHFRGRDTQDNTNREYANEGDTHTPSLNEEDELSRPKETNEQELDGRDTQANTNRESANEGDTQTPSLDEEDELSCQNETNGQELDGHASQTDTDMDSEHDVHAASRNEEEQSSPTETSRQGPGDGENRGKGVTLPNLDELRRRREKRYPKTPPTKQRPLSGSTFKMFLRPIPIGNNTTGNDTQSIAGSRKSTNDGQRRTASLNEEDELNRPKEISGQELDGHATHDHTDTDRDSDHDGDAANQNLEDQDCDNDGHTASPNEEDQSSLTETSRQGPGHVEDCQEEASQAADVEELTANQ